MRNSLVLLLFFVLLLGGCLDKEVFSKVEDSSIVGKTPTSVKITGDKYGVVQIKNDATSNIEVRIQKVIASCSTERARSLGSDFDGYILFEIYKDGKFAAKAQMDFKSEPSKRDFEKVWSTLKNKLDWI